VSTPNYPSSHPGATESLDLARQIIGAKPGVVLPIFGGYLTVWTGVAPYPNTVLANGTTYTNLALINPTLLAVGPVLLIDTPARPIILGRLYTP
jgi:multidrug efflux pump subunit AcrA (membrane-fusion protein)